MTMPIPMPPLVSETIIKSGKVLSLKSLSGTTGSGARRSTCTQRKAAMTAKAMMPRLGPAISEPNNSLLSAQKTTLAMVAAKRTAPR
ncbi:hypothetical protein D3C78_1407700 [compost metagenome]